jgi:hypothetical protein
MGSDSSGGAGTSTNNSTAPSSGDIQQVPPMRE